MLERRTTATWKADAAVPATLFCLSGVYTRMGAGDDLIAGMSTFLLELWNTSFILSKATQRSLVILVRLS